MESQTPFPAPEPASSGPRTNSMATVSLILGIAGLLSFCAAFVLSVIPFAGLVCGGLGILLGIAALVTGIIARQQVKARGESGSEMALAGIIMGSIQMVFLVCIIPLIVIAALTIMGPLVGQVFSTINSSLK